MSHKLYSVIATIQDTVGKRIEELEQEESAADRFEKLRSSRLRANKRKKAKAKHDAGATDQEQQQALEDAGHAQSEHITHEEWAARKRKHGSEDGHDKALTEHSETVNRDDARRFRESLHWQVVVEEAMKELRGMAAKRDAGSQRADYLHDLADDLRSYTFSDEVEPNLLQEREAERRILDELSAWCQQRLKQWESNPELTAKDQPQSSMADESSDVTSSYSNSGESQPAETTPRLKINIGARTVIFDGDTFEANSEQALRWLQVLADRPGEWLTPKDAEAVDPELVGLRSDRLRKRLPPQIAELVEPRPGAGCRLMLPPKMA